MTQIRHVMKLKHVTTPNNINNKIPCLKNMKPISRRYFRRPATLTSLFERLKSSDISDLKLPINCKSTENAFCLKLILLSSSESDAILVSTSSFSHGCLTSEGFEEKNISVVLRAFVHEMAILPTLK